MTQPGRPGVVLDCMVFLQAAYRPGGPAARIFLEFIEAGHLALYASDAILAEVRDVLGRPRIRAKNPTITDEGIEDFFRRKEIRDWVRNVFIPRRTPEEQPN